MSPIAPITTVLFDLDDTLFDHAATARAALAATAAGCPTLQLVPLEELYQCYSDLLEEMHPRVMTGQLSYLAARQLRFQQLLAPYEPVVSAAASEDLAAQHYGHYRRLRQPVAGALALLQRLKPAVKIGIVTNNHTEEQREKLHFLGLTTLVDALITSEDVGVLKPDPAIYQVALERLQARPAATVMVGDNWSADVLGALAVGIRPLWLNRTGAARRLPAVAELTSLEPTAEVYQQIMTPSRGGAMTGLAEV